MSPVFGHGRLRLYLLKLLDEAPRHGYEVIRLLEDRFMGLYAPSAGTVYPRLARLEKEGLVTHSVEGGRKVYRLTDAGRAELEARLDELADLETDLRTSLDAMAREIREEVRGSAQTLREELRNAAREMRKEQRRDNRKGQSKPFGDMLSGGRFAEAMRIAETLGAGRDWLNRMGAGWPGCYGDDEAEPTDAAAKPSAPTSSGAKGTTGESTAARPSGAGPVAPTPPVAKEPAEAVREGTNRAVDDAAAEAAQDAAEEAMARAAEQVTAQTAEEAGAETAKATEAQRDSRPAAPSLDLALLDFVEAVRGAARDAHPDAELVAECRDALAEARSRIERALRAR